VNSNGARLTALTKELWSQWLQTKHYWNDVKGQEFEQKYLQELVHTVDKTATVIDQLDKVMARIKKDCE
jgi:thymidylate synthase